jgi:hypothetical protein
MWLLYRAFALAALIPQSAWSSSHSAPAAAAATRSNRTHRPGARALTQAVGGTLLENTYHIRGNIVSKNDLTLRKADTLQSCFMGFGFRKCEHKPMTAEYDADPEGATALYGPYRSDMPELPPFPFNWRSTFIEDQVYCLECCANTRLSYEFRETWNFECDVSDGGDADLKLMEIMPLEFRFGRRDSIDDETLVTCDLPHESEQTALTSYHLKIYVKEMSEGTVFYRGVTKCEATSTEEAGADAFNDRVVFTERITIILESAGRRRGGKVAGAAAAGAGFAAAAAVAVLLLGWEQS